MATLGVVIGFVGGLGLLSNINVGPGPSYGSSESGLLNILIISWDKPIGLSGGGFGAVLDWRACGPVLVLAEVVVLGAEELGAIGVVADLADDWGPVRGLVDGKVLGKKLSDVSTTGENLIFLLASLQDLS